MASRAPMAAALIWAFALLVAPATTQNVPMSPCVYGRATGGYSVPHPGVPSGVPTGNLGGTCGLANAQTNYPAWFASGYLAAADDETYNGYPWTNVPSYITGTGVGKSCGECFELTADRGTIVVMNVDVCDTGCCSNCLGSQGNDVPDFDVNAAVYTVLTGANGGGVPVAYGVPHSQFRVDRSLCDLDRYRKVSCDMSSLPFGVMFGMANEGTPQEGYFRMRPYGERVGIASIEVKGSVAGGTGGNWTPLKRGWTGNFDWISMGVIGAPFELRVTSVLGQTLTYPGTITFAGGANTKFSFGVQFAQPSPGYGGSSGSCLWPGPSPYVFLDAFGGDPRLKWRDWGSYGTTVSYTQTTGCYSGTCISLSASAAYTAIQIGWGSGVGIPQSYYTSLSVWARSNSATQVQFYFTGGPRNSVSVRQSLTTTWTRYVIPMSSFWAGLGTGNTIPVVQMQFTQAHTGTFLDELQFIDANVNVLVPRPVNLAGANPPNTAIGFPGYTGPAMCCAAAPAPAPAAATTTTAAVSTTAASAATTNAVTNAATTAAVTLTTSTYASTTNAATTVATAAVSNAATTSTTAAATNAATTSAVTSTSTTAASTTRAVTTTASTNAITAATTNAASVASTTNAVTAATSSNAATVATTTSTTSTAASATRAVTTAAATNALTSTNAASTNAATVAATTSGITSTTMAVITAATTTASATTAALAVTSSTVASTTNAAASTTAASGSSTTSTAATAAISASATTVAASTTAVSATSATTNAVTSTVAVSTISASTSCVAVVSSTAVTSTTIAAVTSASTSSNAAVVAASTATIAGVTASTATSIAASTSTIASTSTAATSAAVTSNAAAVTSTRAASSVAVSSTSAASSAAVTLAAVISASSTSVVTTAQAAATGTTATSTIQTTTIAASTTTGASTSVAATSAASAASTSAVASSTAATSSIAASSSATMSTSATATTASTSNGASTAAASISASTTSTVSSTSVATSTTSVASFTTALATSANVVTSSTTTAATTATQSVSTAAVTTSQEASSSVASSTVAASISGSTASASVTSAGPVVSSDSSTVAATLSPASTTSAAISSASSTSAAISSLTATARASATTSTATTSSNSGATTATTGRTYYECMLSVLTDGCIDPASVVDGFTQAIAVTPTIIVYDTCPVSANPTPSLNLRFVVESNNCDEVIGAVETVNATSGFLVISASLTASGPTVGSNARGKKSSKFPLWAIGVIIGGVIVLAAIIAVVLYFVVKRSPRGPIGMPASRANWGANQSALDELYAPPSRL